MVKDRGTTVTGADTDGTRARRRRVLRSGRTTCDRWASAGPAACHQWVSFGRRSPIYWPVWRRTGNTSRPLWTPAGRLAGKRTSGAAASFFGWSRWRLCCGRAGSTNGGGRRSAIGFGGAVTKTVFSPWAAVLWRWDWRPRISDGDNRSKSALLSTPGRGRERVYGVVWRTRRRRERNERNRKKTKRDTVSCVSVPKEPEVKGRADSVNAGAKRADRGERADATETEHKKHTHTHHGTGRVGARATRAAIIDRSAARAEKRSPGTRRRWGGRNPGRG